MYLKSLSLENAGPLRSLQLELPFDADGRPKPIILVGRNGAGKSILLSHIVNAMLDAKNAIYSDGEVEQGKVYKLRSPIYVSHGEKYSSAVLKFDGGFQQSEIMLKSMRADFEDFAQFSPLHPLFRKMEPGENSRYDSNFAERTAELEQMLQNFSLLYFPPDRFEEPAWLNVDNLRANATYSKRLNVKGISGRNVIRRSAMAQNQDWLLDVIYDAYALDRQFAIAPDGLGGSLNVFLGFSGTGTSIRIEIESFLGKLLGVAPPFRWHVGRRGNRSVGLNFPDDTPVVQNLFSLSTGQLGLLNIFLSIIRDFDLSLANITSLVDVRGVVIIDEVDLHLHAGLQHQLLPILLRTFPNVQFILTTHSPLFILGMEKEFGSYGYDLIDLPSGKRIGPERFAEFGTAYQYLAETQTHADAINRAVHESQRPLLFVEGTIDIDYLKHAASLLGRSEILERYDLRDADGYGGLDKLYKHFDHPVSKLLNQKVTLVYDCDVDKARSEKPGVRPIVLETLPRKIKKGIENRLPDDLIPTALMFDSWGIPIRAGC